MLQADKKICTDIDTEGCHGAASAPIYQTSLFTFNTFRDFTEAQKKERERYVYTRGVNPTVNLLEYKLAALERGEQCKCFGSGMGAVSSIFLSLLNSNDHVLFVNNIYGPTTELMEVLQNFNISCDYVSHDVKEIEASIQPNTKLIYAESPGTMLMKVVDLKKTAEIAKKHNITTVIDNTWSTPLFQKPLRLGFDLSLHSLTKYIGGHSDVIGGAVIGRADLVDRIFKYGFQLGGSVLSPHDAFLILRGLRTLPVRLGQHQANVLKIIDYLQTKKAVKQIYHPKLWQNPAIARQMLGYTGLISFELKDTSFETLTKFIDSLVLFKIGVSWGGFESLVTSPQKEGNEEQLKAAGLPSGLIRLSIGLEGDELQISDLEKAFSTIS
ncbi:trans-sulfuration enzyme family protein [Salibacterium aidingense]|uniref:trans-sulfuration enzyme family protein n=1 Tax=Salibacterium aidingense TaxID=384933 RepID=UPI003BC916E8